MGGGVSAYRSHAQRERDRYRREQRAIQRRTRNIELEKQREYERRNQAEIRRQKEAWVQEYRAKYSDSGWDGGRESDNLVTGRRGDGNAGVVGGGKRLQKKWWNRAWFGVYEWWVLEREWKKEEQRRRREGILAGVEGQRVHRD